MITFRVVDKNISKYFENERHIVEYYSEKNRKPRLFGKFPILPNKINLQELPTDKILETMGSRKRAALDLTWSASKSISVAAIALGEEKVREAWEKGIERFIQESQRYIYTRKKEGEERKYVQAEGAWMVFTHELSREGDPQIHAHCLILNKVRRDDGKYTALCAEMIVERKYFLDTIANLETLYRLQQAGYKAYLDSHNNCEIGGISETIQEIFSKRRRQVEELARERGISIQEASRELREVLVLLSRKDKEHASKEGLVQRWEEDLQKIGLSIQKIKEEFERFHSEWKEREKRYIKDEELREAFMKATKTMEEAEGVFTKEKLFVEFVRELNVYIKEQDILIPEVDKLKSFFEKQMEQNLVHLATINHIKKGKEYRGMQIMFYTTENYLKTEQKTLELAKELAQQERKFTYEEEIEAKIKEFEKEKGFSLKDEQKNAVRAILAGTGLTLIQGDAGAGKTTSLEAVAMIAQEKNIKLLGLAPTGKAAEEMSKSLGYGQTVDSFLLEFEKEPKKVLEKIEGSILIVDEAGMLGLKKTHQLLKIAQKLNCKIVLQGDAKQFPPIEAGQFFADIQKQEWVEKVELKSIRRQKKEEYRSITTALSRKNFATAFQRILEGSYFVEMGNQKEKIEKVIEDYLSLDYKETLLLASTNAEKDTLNQVIRRKLQEQEKIGQDELTAVVRQRINSQTADFRRAETYAKGDYVTVKQKEFLQWLKRHGYIDTLNYRITEVRIERINTENNEVQVSFTLQEKKRNKKEKLEKTLSLTLKASDLARYAKEIQREKIAEFARGDKILCLKNSKKLGLKNGETFIVAEVKGDKMVLVAENTRKRVSINLKEYNWIDHAYAVTCYRSQGMTVKNVLCVADVMDFNSFYVTITRGKENCRIYTTDAIRFLFESQFPKTKRTSLSLLSMQQKEEEVLRREEIAEMYIEKLFTKHEKGKISLEELKRKFWNSIKYIDSFSKQKEFRKKLSEVLEQQKEQQKEKLQKQEQIQVQQQEKQQEKQQEQVKIKMIKKQAKNFIIER